MECFDTQDGIVRRLLVGRGGGLRCAETGMWSEVVESCVRGSQCVFVCGCRSCSVEVKMFVYMRSIRVMEIALCLVGIG